MNIQQTARDLSTALGVDIDKTHENAYQRVFKTSSAVKFDITGAQQRGLITVVKDGPTFQEFTMGEHKFVAVPTLGTITSAKPH